MPTFVVGSGGMVGRSILALNTDFRAMPIKIPWEDKTKSIEVLEKFCAQLSPHEKIGVVWAAGAGVVGTNAKALSEELDVFDAFVQSLVKSKCSITSFTLISSAGGVYSGNKETLISEETRVNPTSNYGQLKFRQEMILTSSGKQNAFKVVIARLSNVYGTNQNMNKRQGLISNLVRATFSREPLSIFVPIDTRRDYINSHDVGQRIGRLVKRAEELEEELIVKIICAGKTHTISEIIGEIKAVSKRKPPIIFSLSTLSSQHPKSLAFESKVHNDIDNFNQVLLPAGIKEICDMAVLAKSS